MIAVDALRSRRPMLTRVAIAALVVCAGGVTASAQNGAAAPERWMAQIDGEDVPAPEVNLASRADIEKILDEGKNRNQVMRHIEHLTKKIGARLTGSTNAETANRWCADQYRMWGLTNVQVEEWGTIPMRFDRGPSTGKLLGTATDGSNGDAAANGVLRELEFTTYAWGAGTNGPVRGPVVMMPESEEAYKAVRDSLKGAWILMPNDESSGRRRGGAAAARYRAAGEARAKVREEKLDPASFPDWEDRMLFDGINGFISSSRDERVWTSSAPDWRRLTPDSLPVDVFVTVRQSDYDYMKTAIDEGKPFQAEFDLQNTFIAGPSSCYNTIAEIPGTEWPEQVVIVSAHLDSWNGPGSEGCTDNGTGSSVTLEAARILMAAGVKPKRTIRFINWTGEEQGLLGSRAYVEKHKDDLAKNVSMCLVDDGGTNYEGGLNAVEGMVPMLAAATAPVNWAFPDMKVNVKTVKRMPRGGASDHASFNAIGIPGFFWDEVGRADYGYGWHTQNDKLDLAIPEYLVQSSTCAAVTAFNIACADTLLPREIPEEPKAEAAPEPKPAEVVKPIRRKRITP